MALYFALDHQDMARQIAALLNSCNLLKTRKTTQDILDGRNNYVVESHGRWVLGAVGLDRQSYTFTEIKHLVTHPNWRDKGIAKHLLKRALAIATTKMVYATVRENNEASVKLFRGIGFRDSGDYAAGDHRVILLVRVNPQWEQTKSALRSNWAYVRGRANPFVNRPLLNSAGRGVKIEAGD